MEAATDDAPPPPQQPPSDAPPPSSPPPLNPPPASSDSGTPPPLKPPVSTTPTPTPSTSSATVAATIKPPAAAVAADDDTRVITLDTIIRKGLIERMPMTAKDIAGIVSKSMQKERDRQAADRVRMAAEAPRPPVFGAPPAVQRNAAASTSQPKANNDSNHDDDSSADSESEYNDDSNDDDDGNDRDGEGDDENHRGNKEAEKRPAAQETPTIAVQHLNPMGGTAAGISVIQRAPPLPPPPTISPQQQQQQQQQQDARTETPHPQLLLPEAGGDCLCSGDLHYSGSNTSDYSDAEHHHHHHHQRQQTSSAASPHRQPARQRQSTSTPTTPTAAQRRKRNTTANRTPPATAAASSVGAIKSALDVSCTDSKRNAILLQAAKVQRRAAQPPKTQAAAECLSAPSNKHNGGCDEEVALIKRERLTPPVDGIAAIQAYESTPVPTKTTATNRKQAAKKSTPHQAKEPGGGKRKKPTVDLKTVQSSIVKAIPAASESDLSQSATFSSPPSQTTTPISIAAAAGRRDKRQTVAKSTPVYAELSDNDEPTASNTNSGLTATGKPKKQRSPRATTVTVSQIAAVAAAKSPTALPLQPDPSSAVPPVPTAPKMHWKTQLKLQRQQMMEQTATAAAAAASAVAAAAAVDPAAIVAEVKVETESLSNPSSVETDAASVVAVGDHPPPAAALDDTVSRDSVASAATTTTTASTTGGGASETPSVASSASVVNKIIEPPHHQKRIPKLKYGSFNFTERRGLLASKGPKMVLKYKKKYKRKLTHGSTASAAAEAAASLDETVDSELAPVPMDVKSEQSSSNGHAELSNSSEPTSNITPIKKRKSVKSTTGAAGNVGAHEPPIKQPKPAANKSLKMPITTTAADGGATATSTAYAIHPPAIAANNDSVRALRERNKVLLELLEHRIYEIRHLKLRLAHMQQAGNAVPLDRAFAGGGFDGQPQSGAAALRPKLEPGVGGAEQSTSTAAAAAALMPSPTTADRQPNAAGCAASTISDATPDWSADELAHAYSLYSLQPRLYAHLQQCYSLPLPLATECASWPTAATAGQRSLECGVQLDMLRLLQADAAHLSAVQRCCVLQLSTLRLRPSFEYAPATDRLRRCSAARMHVLWARSLLAEGGDGGGGSSSSSNGHDWQRPVYVGTEAGAALVRAIRDAAAQLHAIGYTVIACCAPFDERRDRRASGASANTTTSSSTTNGGSQNTAPTATAATASAATDDSSSTTLLWQQLGVTRGYSYFSHPVTAEPVYTFFYAADVLRAAQLQLLLRSPTGGFSTTDRPVRRLRRQPLDAVGAVAGDWLAAAERSCRVLFSARSAELLRAVRPAEFEACADLVDVFGAYARLVFGEVYGGRRLEAQTRALGAVQLQLYKLRVGGGSDKADDTAGGPVPAASGDAEAAATAAEESGPVFAAALQHSIESLKLLQHTLRQKYGCDAFPAFTVSVDALQRRWCGGDCDDEVAADEAANDATASEYAAESFRDTLLRLRSIGAEAATVAPTMRAGRRRRTPTPVTASSGSWSPAAIDVTRPERHYVQRLIDGMLHEQQQDATSAERQQKFAADLWRMEDRFQSLWTPFYVSGAEAPAAGADAAGAGTAAATTAAAEPSGGGAKGLVLEHVLRDTLGKLRPPAGRSLECAVRFMQQRIALRVAVVNALGGVERWPSYVLATSAAAAAARRSMD